MKARNDRVSGSVLPSRKGRGALLWGLVFFVSGQMAFGLIVEYWRPELRDLEYGYRLQRLRARLREESDRPLVLLLGSSRVEIGIRPEAFPTPDTLGGPAPIVFNFGLTASGPVMELLCLHRLIADGIRPDGLVVEVLAPLLHQPYSDQLGGDWLNIARVAWRDLTVLERYATPPRPVYREWWQTRLLPCFTHRFCILSWMAPAFVPGNARQDHYRNIDRSGWLACARTSVTEEEQRRGLRMARAQYAWRLAPFQIDEAPDRALRALLQRCRSERIPVLLLMMPEGSDFRAWYPAETEARIDRYLAELSREYKARVVDARCWMADTDFNDGHHLLLPGATAFSERFGREAFAPFWEHQAITTGSLAHRTRCR